MTTITHFTTIEHPTQAELKIKGSRFIAFAYPVCQLPEIKCHIQQQHHDHPKARHWCYAWRLGFDKTLFRANDDGEPAGSAGRPILNQIDSAGLTQVLVVVVRYFGGTLLGVPGLIHAYKTVSHDALSMATKITQPILCSLYITCSYPQLNEVLHICKQYQATILEKTLHLMCQLTIAVPQQHQESIESLLTQRNIVISRHNHDASPCHTETT